MQSNNRSKIVIQNKQDNKQEERKEQERDKERENENGGGQKKAT